MSYTRYNYSNNRYSITLYREGSASNAPTRHIKLWGDSPLLVERDERAPMEARWGMRCELHLTSETHYAYEHIVLDDRDWRMVVTVGGEQIFSGRVERGLYEESYDSLPYECVITASCGIKRLDDYRLNLDTLPRSEMQLASLREIVLACLKLSGESKVEFRGNSEGWLNTAHINPEIYRTDEEGMISTETAGEVLDGILSSLGLICYHTGSKWCIESVSELPNKESVTLETQEHYLEGTPTLRTEAAIGSVRINLPSEGRQSVYTLHPPTAPLPICPYSEDYFKVGLPPLLRLSASAQLAKGVRLPDTLERSRGITLHVPYVAGEALALSIPYNPPQGATGVKIEIELGFKGLEEGDDGEIQAVAEIKACDDKEPHFLSCWGGHCYSGVDKTDPTQFRRLRQAHNELRDNSLSGQLCYLYGEAKEGINAFRSLYSSLSRRQYDDPVMPRLMVHEVLRNHLPYAKVQRSDLKGGKMGRFSFSTDLVYPQTLEIHNERRRDRGLSHNTQLSRIALYIPMRFWLTGSSKEVIDITPTELLIGRVYITYEYAAKGEYDAFVIADRKGSYQRKGEDIDLRYTTRIKGITLPPSLKGQLTDSRGTPLESLYGRTTPEWIASAYFAAMGKPHDTLTLTTNTPTPYTVGTRFRLRNRPGHSYRLMGSRYDVRGGTSELTLAEAPTHLEETRYDL